VVQFISVEQIISGRVWRQHVVCGHYCLLCTARLHSGSASVYLIHGGPRIA